MALQAKHVHVAELEQVRVGRAMGDMAGRAAFGLDGFVLENERTVFVDVALVANGVLSGGCAHLLGRYRAVRVMAIATLHESLVDAMVERHGELRLLLQMAGVAELGLGLDEQELGGLRVMRRMARRAADFVLTME